MHCVGKMHSLHISEVVVYVVTTVYAWLKESFLENVSDISLKNSNNI
jgi:hypothetical protein